MFVALFVQHLHVMCALVFAASILEHLQALDGAAAIIAMQLVLIIGCVGVPAPEEAVFATCGFLSATGCVLPLPAFAACWATLWVLDGLFYEVGRRSGRRMRHSALGQRVSRRRWAWIRRHMARHGMGTVVVGRLILGMRIPTFLLAGASRMPRGRFWLASGMGGLLSGGIPFALGWVLADALPALIQGLSTGKWVIAGLMVLAMVAVGVVLMRKPTREPLRGRSESVHPPR